ncbi:MAG: 16S rRNA (cytosine(1402)-N(4))-methyltransferase RsmH [Flavobacteriaceae bacterium]
MLEEAIQGLKIDPDGVYVDVTFGGGGHSRAILKKLSQRGRLLALDQDEAAQKNTISDDRFHLIGGNFSHLKRHLNYCGITSVNGILADFGVSSHQFDIGSRGFSTRLQGPLDMRMNTQNELSAYEVVNQYSLEELQQIFKSYGELRIAKKLADHIVKGRVLNPIATTQALVDLLTPILPKHVFNKIIAQVFQAIRIEVNAELDVIKFFLEQSIELLCKGGRLVCISYHSLEDRLVKIFIREGKFEGKAESDLYGNRNLPLKKVGNLQTPSNEEINDNRRARSGKLRVAERI